MTATPTHQSKASQPPALEFDISGMTCASCANRIERKLNKLDGVEATVNYATERASVFAPAALSVADIQATVEAAGYAAHPVPPPQDRRSDRRDPGSGESATPLDRHDQELANLRQRLIGASWLSVPVIALAMVPALQFTYWQWASLTLAAPVVTWAAWPFHRAAWVNLRHGATTMDTLVSLGVTASSVWSLIALFFGTAGMPGMTHGYDFAVTRGDGLDSIYLEVAVGVTTFLLAGRYFEKRSKRRAGDALRALMQLGAKEVTVLEAGAERRIPIEQLSEADEFVVRPGEQIATDGVVIEGTSSVNAAMVTGEPVPVDVAPGDAVMGATINVAGRLVVRATRVGEDTQLARMARLVEQAQSGKAEVQRLADRVSAYFVPIVIVLSVLTGTFWVLRGETLTFALGAAIAVLIIACPCALGLATPTALMVGTGRGAQLGILIRGPEVLESTRRIDTVVLDKTGTITTGEMSLREIIIDDGDDGDDGDDAAVDAAEVGRIAASLEAGSAHPIALAIAGSVDEAERLPVEDFLSLEGVGVRGRVDGRWVVVAAPSRLPEVDGVRPEVGDRLARAVAAAEADGHTVVATAWEGRVRGLLVVSDTVKPTSAEAVRQLRALGLDPLLVTGDNERAARAVAAHVGIDEVVAGVLPEGKVAEIARLQASGRRVAMVGDGVNDAAALAQADLGLALGTGLDAAIAAADLTLVRGDLRVAADAVRLSRRTLRTIQTNLVWAFGYNVVALPLAAAGLLNPMIAGGAMAASSVLVVANSLRLRRFV